MHTTTNCFSPDLTTVITNINVDILVILAILDELKSLIQQVQLNQTNITKIFFVVRVNCHVESDILSFLKENLKQIAYAVTEISVSTTVNIAKSLCDPVTSPVAVSKPVTLSVLPQERPIVTLSALPREEPRKEPRQDPIELPLTVRRRMLPVCVSSTVCRQLPPPVVKQIPTPEQVLEIIHGLFGEHYYVTDITRCCYFRFRMCTHSQNGTCNVLDGIFHMPYFLKDKFEVTFYNGKPEMILDSSRRLYKETIGFDQLRFMIDSIQSPEEFVKSIMVQIDEVRRTVHGY